MTPGMLSPVKAHKAFEEIIDTNIDQVKDSAEASTY